VVENLFFKDCEGKNLFLIGTNYWPATSAINMWTEWYPAELVDDVKRMKGLGMNCCRPFLFLPAFLEKEGTVNPVMLDRLGYFLNVCEENKLYTFPTFIVGHMSGEDWGVPWMNGPELIGDRRVIEITKSYITSVIQVAKVFKYVLGWLLSNELSNFIGNQNPADVMAWVKEITATIRSIDPQRPISVGDGAWSPEVISEQTGFHLRKLNSYQDFVGLHYYPRGMSPWHHTYTTAFRTQLAKVWGKPVVVEEFGTSTTLCSEENQANYFRTVFFSALINGAQGTLSWCLNDFDFVNKRPYSHHLSEERFGVIRSDKTFKPAAYEFEKFRKICSELTKGEFEKNDNNVGLFIPSNYYYKYPYEFQTDIGNLYDFYLECFSLLKRVNQNVNMIVEPAQEIENGGLFSHDLKLDGLPVLFLPRLKFMTKPTKTALDKYINEGGIMYFSFANDSLVNDWDKLAGVITDCKFGVPDFRNVQKLDVEVNSDWGEFQKNEHFSLPLLNNQPSYGYCPILSTTAKVIMTDQLGMPFLIENQVGKGKVYFMPYPIEALSSGTNDDCIKMLIGRIYKSIIHLNQQAPEISVNGDGLEFGVWENNTEKRLVILNHSWSEQLGRIRLQKSVSSLESSIPIIKKDENSFQLTLPRKEVAYIRIRWL